MFLTLVFVFIALKQGETSHFRGGTISWAPVNPNITFPVSQVEVYITTRFFWKLVSTQCDSSACIAAGNLIGDTGTISPINGNAWSIDSQTNCYDYSLADGWMEGVNTQIVNITTAMAVSASFASCCWVNGIISVLNSTNWNLTFVIDLKQRTDTNLINSSPTTSIKSYVQLGIGCANNQSLAIPVSDVDGDLVRCRCSQNVCLTGFSIDSVNCIMYFNPTLIGYYALDLLIEDFAPSSPNVALSSLPLQVIAYVDSKPVNCCKHMSIIPKQFFFLDILKEHIELNYFL